MTIVIWLRVKKEIVSIEISHYENGFKYKSYDMEVMYTNILLPCSIRKWKYGDGKKIMFEIIADSDCTTLKTLKKVVFRKVSVCVSVCL